MNKLQFGRRCLTCGRPAGDHVGFKCPDRSPVANSPFENKQTLQAWWGVLKRKNGFLVMSKNDKQVLEKIVMTYIEEVD
jgi:hypothetical protein